MTDTYLVHDYLICCFSIGCYLITSLESPALPLSIHLWTLKVLDKQPRGAAKAMELVSPPHMKTSFPTNVLRIIATASLINDLLTIVCITNI